jgi:hypothetical protein
MVGEVHGWSFRVGAPSLDGVDADEGDAEVAQLVEQPVQLRPVWQLSR